MAAKLIENKIGCVYVPFGYIWRSKDIGRHIVQKIIVDELDNKTKYTMDKTIVKISSDKEVKLVVDGEYFTVEPGEHFIPAYASGYSNIEVVLDNNVIIENCVPHYDLMKNLCQIFDVCLIIDGVKNDSDGTNMLIGFGRTVSAKCIMSKKKKLMCWQSLKTRSNSVDYEKCHKTIKLDSEETAFKMNNDYELMQLCTGHSCYEDHVLIVYPSENHEAVINILNKKYNLDYDLICRKIYMPLEDPSYDKDEEMDKDAKNFCRIINEIEDLGIIEPF